MSTVIRLRAFAGRVLDRLDIKDGAKRILASSLDQLGLQHDLYPLAPEESARRMLDNSCHFLQSLPEPTTGRRVLFLTGRSYLDLFTVNDAIMAWSVRLRGAVPLLLLCDEALTACEVATVNNYPSDDAFLAAGRPVTCENCFGRAREILEAFELPYCRYGDFVDSRLWSRAKSMADGLSVEECFALEYLGIPIGEQVEATVYRTLLRATLDSTSDFVLRTARRLLSNAIVMAEIAQAAYEVLRPDVVVAHHGVYLTSGIFCALMRHRGVRIVTWNMAYRRGSLMFSHRDTYHRTIFQEPSDFWDKAPLSAGQQRVLDSYLSSHWKSGWDWISYNRDANEDSGQIAQILNLDPARPIIGMFTNIQWDARIHYSGVVFASHAEWLVETVRFFLDRPDQQLVIRVHPAEVQHTTGKARERADEIIARHFPTLPNHIKVIAPEDKLSSYALVELCSATIVFGTKLGIEMASRGLPVIIAGEAWYRGKGFTCDPKSPAEYFELLATAGRLPKNSPDVISRARRYAYHFFFRRMISFPSLGFRREGTVVRSPKDLLPGKDSHLDTICDGILNVAPFVDKA